MCEIIKRLNELTLNSKTIYVLGRAEMSKVVRAYHNIKKQDLDPKMSITNATKIL